MKNITLQIMDFGPPKGILIRKILKEPWKMSYLMETEATRQREFGVYAHVQDNYPKFVLSMDTINFSQDGIVHKHVVDFLLENAEV